MKKRYICLFEVYLFVAEDPVPPCALVGMTLFRNVYVHVPKRAGDQYQCNERDKYLDYKYGMRHTVWNGLWAELN